MSREPDGGDVGGSGRSVAVVGASLDLGAGRRGVDMGPSAIRYAGLEARLAEIGCTTVDRGNVEAAIAEAVPVGNERVRFLREIADTTGQIADLVQRALVEEHVPLVLGGDHSVALGTLAGLARVHGPGGVLWIDAHGDLNRPETSPTGNVHGMVLAAALGLAGEEFADGVWGFPAVERAALAGVRQLDPGERRLLQELDVRVFTMSDIDRVGVEQSILQALEHVAGAGFVHVSLDMDALDPEIAPGVGTPVKGGLSYREAHLAMELVAESGLAGSLEVVEVNPILDRENATAELAVELVASALGARIL
jgi:arginase